MLSLIVRRQLPSLTAKDPGRWPGVLPVVGVPLPQMSYGCTSMLTTLAGLGIAMAAYSNRQQSVRPELLGFL